MPSPQPDLVLIMTDQQRHDQVGYVGESIVMTPNLDRLATDGVIFGSAYSASTTCVPARTSLLTGLLDHRTPYLAPMALEPGTWTVPHALTEVGYQTALVGKMHFNPIRADHGFEHMRLCEHVNAYPGGPAGLAELDHYHDWLLARGIADWRLEPRGLAEEVYQHPSDTHPTSWVRDQAVEFLRHRDLTRPLFLVISFPHPHPPINPPEPYASRYDPSSCLIDPDGDAANRFLPRAFRDTIAQADAPHRRVDPAHLGAHQADLARTYGLITQIDDAVGDIMEHLALEETVLAFTADHGDFAGRRGLIRKVPWIPFDDLARVPCFVTGGAVRGGRVESHPMQSFDLAATWLDYAGVEVDHGLLDGQSLRALLEDPAATLSADRLVYCAISMLWPMVRRGPHKYIRGSWGAEVLFDLERDPGEVLDLKAVEGAPAIVAELSGAVDEQQAATIPDLPRFATRPMAPSRPSG